METSVSSPFLAAGAVGLDWMVKAYGGLAFPVGVCGTDGRWLFLNRPAIEFLGVERADQWTRADAASWGGFLAPAVDEAESVLDGNSGYFRDARTDKVYQRLSSPLADEDGRSLGTLEFLHDATEQYAVEERLRIMFNSMPFTCNYWSREGRHIDCNQATLGMFGIKDKKAFIERFNELSPPLQPDGEPSATQAVRHVNKAFAEGWDRFEWMHRDAAGAPLPVEVTLVRVKHRKDDAVLAYARDLRSSRTVADVDDLGWLLRVFDSLPFPTGVSGVSGKWLLLNKAALAFYGVDRMEALPAMDAADWGGRLKRIPEEPGVETTDAPYYADTKDDRIYRRQSSSLHDDLGCLVGRVECIQDVTTAHEADERMRMMVDAAPFVCTVWDGNLRNLYCNLEAIKLFSLPDRKSYQENFFRLSPPKQPDGSDSVAEIRRIIPEVFRNGFARFSWMHQKLDGEPIPVEVTLIRVGGRKGDFVVGYLRDLRNPSGQ